MRDGWAESGQHEQTGGEAGTLPHSLTHSLSHSLSTENVEAVCCQFMFQTLHATSQDGSSLEFVAATVGREYNIQDARGKGLWMFNTCHTDRTAGPAKLVHSSGWMNNIGIELLSLDNKKS